VRGLDYYTRTAFEVMAGGLGAQSTVVAGGRYDGLVETMGGAAVAGIGFAIGIDRMALALEAAGVLSAVAPDAAIIAMGPAAMRRATLLARVLRANKMNVEMLSPERKMKTLLARASKIGARYAVIIGDDELARGVVQLRNLKESTQSEVQEVQLGEAARAIAESRTK
jgi:histidyl-tRNA synthetase